MDWIRERLTYANVVATLALFLALGGTSIAALRIGSKQVRNNSLRSVDIRDNDLRGRDIRNSTLTGADVRDHSLRANDLAPESLGSSSISNLQAGDFAPGQLPDPVPGTLPRGKTLKGVFGAAVTGGPGDSGIARAAISFPISLATEPASRYIAAGTPPPPECPGTVAEPAAAPGYLCVYEGAAIGPSAFRGVFHPVTGDNDRSSRFGAIVFINGQASVAVRGTWAVTAP